MGIEDPPEVDYEAEYIDEERYTTVTVEAMDVSKEGLYRAEREGEQTVNVQKTQMVSKADTNGAGKPKRVWAKENPRDGSDRPKKKRGKFRYETKAVRKETRMKERSKNSKQARERRSK